MVSAYRPFKDPVKALFSSSAKGFSFIGVGWEIGFFLDFLKVFCNLISLCFL